MPQSRENYRGYIVSRVPWTESDWRPDRCHNCRHDFDHDNYPDAFYDVQDRHGVILDEDTGFCSPTCAEMEIDAVRARRNQNDRYDDNDTQEEATED